MDHATDKTPDTTRRAAKNVFRAAVTGPGVLAFTLGGRLDASTTSRMWPPALEILRKKAPKSLLIRAGEVTYCDGAGLGFLFDLKRQLVQSGGEALVEGLTPELSRLLDQFDPRDFDRPAAPETKKHSAIAAIGEKASGYLNDLAETIAFVGEMAESVVQTMRHPRQLRWGDVWRVAETAGVNALPIVTLISFLVGLIMAFQAAIPMKMFGAEIYVANLIALSVVRELGPLMTAIVLAGRSGSAFAAEIGTMKVNEEVDALITMGLNPIRFLVAPRVLAAVMMTPILTIYADLIGVLGGSIPLMVMGYSLPVYAKQVISSIHNADFLGGIVKSFVFGITIAGVGCLRGLQTLSGPSAVGDSTTRSVVSGIVLITVLDGVFSVVYYYLGI